MIATGGDVAGVRGRKTGKVLLQAADRLTLPLGEAPVVGVLLLPLPHQVFDNLSGRPIPSGSEPGLNETPGSF